MIRSLTIEGYRGFKRFEMGELGRVNLLVGTNNSGKTSVLEAIQFLTSNGAFDALAQIMWRRGEVLRDGSSGDSAAAEFDIRHLLHGHELGDNIRFHVRTGDGPGERGVSCVVHETVSSQVACTVEGFEGKRFQLRIESQPPGSRREVSLTHRGGLVNLGDPSMAGRGAAVDQPPRVRFVASESLSVRQIGALWQTVALTQEEDLAVDALRLVEPEIERIAFIGAPDSLRLARGGFAVKCRGWKERVPLGSMGDGMWRLLALGLALAGTRSEEGVLLVDEIDTGLHHTVMEDMWRMIHKTSERLGVQVFATTHSYDCVYSLASICRQDVKEGSEVTIQRIEPEHGRAVAFSEREIALAAERNIEVR